MGTLMPYYKNRGLPLSFVNYYVHVRHSSFKQTISSSSFVLNIMLFLKKEIGTLSQISALPGGIKSK